MEIKGGTILAESNNFSGFPMEFVSFDEMSDVSNPEIFQLLYKYNQALLKGENPDISSLEWNALYPYVFNAKRYNDLSKTVQNMETFLLSQVDGWIFDLWSKLVGDPSGDTEDLSLNQNFWTAIRNIKKIISDFVNSNAINEDDKTIGGFIKYIENRKKELDEKISSFIDSSAIEESQDTIGGFVLYLKNNYVPNSEIVKQEVKSNIPVELRKIIKICETEEDLPPDGSSDLVEGDIYLVPIE